MVYGHTTPGVASLDETVIARAPWMVERVNLPIRPFYLARRVYQEFARSAFAWGLSSVRWAASGHSIITPALARAAMAQPADLFIGHYLASLPAIYDAARLNNAKMGFDAEDDHLDELERNPANRSEFDIRRRIEAQFISKCEHLTAASPRIAQAYKERYGVEMMTVLNVFPREHALQAGSFSTGKDKDALSVYWFSQTIGPGRGLEPIILAMAKLRRRVRLFIRGSDHLGYSVRLRELAAESGVADLLSFLPSAWPEEMVRLAAAYDVGLASELNSPPNRAKCLSNKIFTYLLAGVPVLLSDTPAQRDLAAELGNAASLVDLDSQDQIVKALDAWAGDPDKLMRDKAHAKLLGDTKFNWDIEKSKILRSVSRLL
ncbi:hypothetical protein [Rhodoplanes sp. Z2-YC6860]|uniref:hypothetical protein n=1 Tax=Rhodoplanes sp. Z2-YC6860 TaxID=674703 RepID=UPI0012EDE838|nr:hypothetical protein [Rhodoplanes sp. Z2-YC6860]